VYVANAEPALIATKIHTFCSLNTLWITEIIQILWQTN